MTWVSATNMGGLDGAPVSLLLAYMSLGGLSLSLSQNWSVGRAGRHLLGPSDKKVTHTRPWSDPATGLSPRQDWFEAVGVPSSHVHVPLVQPL